MDSFEQARKIFSQVNIQNQVMYHDLDEAMKIH